MRLFVALDIEDIIRNKISRFVEDVRELAPDARWVKPESLHVTLKFIGETSNEELEQSKSALSTIDAGMIETNIRSYGFFPTAKAPRVFWIGIEAGPSLPALAALVDEKLAAIRIPKEKYPYNPHLTLARGAGGSGSPLWRKVDSPNRSFQPLQEKLMALAPLEFGTMTSRDFFLYRSQLSPGGSIYTKLASFPLHGLGSQ
jgi:2'-5' RNA ligase